MSYYDLDFPERPLCILALSTYIQYIMKQYFFYSWGHKVQFFAGGITQQRELRNSDIQ
jgi:hypothetical protein